MPINISGTPLTSGLLGSYNMPKVNTTKNDWGIKAEVKASTSSVAKAIAEVTKQSKDNTEVVQKTGKAMKLVAFGMKGSSNPRVKILGIFLKALADAVTRAKSLVR